MRDGKHLRFKNINFSYSLPQSLRMGTFEEVRLFFNGYNLFVLKGYEEDFDPQMQSSVGWYYPQTKSLTFGLNLTL
jgi:hypothetical protein